MRANEKVPMCRLCLEIQRKDVHSFSDGFLYDEKSMINIGLISLKSKEKKTPRLPVEKPHILKVKFEKEVQINFKVMVSDLKGFDQDGLNKGSLETYGYDRDRYREKCENEYESTAITKLTLSMYVMFFVQV